MFQYVSVSAKPVVKPSYVIIDTSRAVPGLGTIRVALSVDHAVGDKPYGAGKDVGKGTMASGFGLSFRKNQTFRRASICCRMAIEPDRRTSLFGIR